MLRTVDLDVIVSCQLQFLGSLSNTPCLKIDSGVKLREDYTAAVSPPNAIEYLLSQNKTHTHSLAEIALSSFPQNLSYKSSLFGKEHTQ